MPTRLSGAPSTLQSARDGIAFVWFMPVENYAEASIRHFSDAEHLACSGRFDSAGHLIGFAAECAIKHAVLSLAAGPVAKLHIPLLIEHARKRLHGQRDRAVHTLIGDPAFFDGWRVEARYESDGGTDASRYASWRVAASRTIGAAGLRKRP